MVLLTTYEDIGTDSQTAAPEIVGDSDGLDGWAMYGL